MSGKIFVINGPNLGALGKREPGIYGALTLNDIESLCEREAESLGLSVEFRQSNHEGQMVDWLHEAAERAAGVALNPAAYGHTSVALHDAVRAIAIPVVELHLSNIHAREEFRHKSLVAPVAAGVICGFGAASYALALRALADLIGARKKQTR